MANQASSEQCLSATPNSFPLTKAMVTFYTQQCPTNEVVKTQRPWDAGQTMDSPLMPESLQ